MKRYALISFFFSLIGCTDLKEKPISEATPEQFFVNNASVEGVAIPAYSSLHKYIWNYWNINEVTTDEIQSRWHEEGYYIRLNSHNFNTGDPFFYDLWTDCFEGVKNCDDALELLQYASKNVTIAPQLRAEVRTLRAFYYYLLLDTFGNVPLLSKFEKYPNQLSRKQLFEYCEKELKESLPALPKVAPVGKVTSGVALSILNKLYLNAEIYTGTARWEDCISTANEIINSNVYQLENNYYDNFKLENSDCKEAIFTIQFSRKIDLGWPNMNFYMRSLHYNQMSASPWNGFCTIAEVYDTFDSTDTRRDALWEGPQFLPLRWPKAQTEGIAIKDRPGNQLVFTKSVNLTGQTEFEGIRVVKYEPDPLAPAGQGENDYLIFRFSDILLSKAESLFRLGRANEALESINLIRKRAFNDQNHSLKSLTLKDIYDERTRELYWEGHRRQDMIRFDTFWDKYTNKNDTRSQKKRTIIFPIPLDAMVQNPNLKQNPFY
jgi:starch-binding outer membrane protein, SusD/RagB family